MKGQKKLYFILVPAVLLVWVIIIYKVISVVYPENNNVQNAIPAGHKNLIKKNVEGYSVTGDYRDPFLPPIHIKKVVDTGIKVKPKQVVPKINKPWPKIEYLGFVNKNTHETSPLLYMKIDGRSRYMKSGDIKDDVKLTRITKDSVEVIFMSESKYIFSKSKLKNK